jgi:hypothetical protein
VLVHDARETSPFTAVDGGPPETYARRAGSWLQYWLYARKNPQDRGIVRTGRHEGDWELVMVELGRTGAPVRVVASQHAGGESCDWAAVEHEGDHPVVFVANGSHAGYFRAGIRDRTWPDPNDEAGGDGRRERPTVVGVDASHPAWMRRRAPWGASRAGVVPGEMDSPRGPAFQGIRWQDPAAYARKTSECRSLTCARRGACDIKENAIAGGAASLLAILVAGCSIRRRPPKRRWQQ